MARTLAATGTGSVILLYVFHRPVVEDDLGEGEVHVIEYRHGETWSHPKDPAYCIANGLGRRQGGEEWVPVRVLFISPVPTLRNLVDLAEVRL